MTSEPKAIKALCALARGVCASFGKIALAALAAIVVSCSSSHPETAPPLEALKDAHCRIWDGTDGIPHVQATSELQALSCMGYLHARDRFSQMEYFRRTAYGENATVAGKGAIRTDFLFRMLGLRGRAGKIVSELSRPEREKLEAYAWGVTRGSRGGVWHAEDTIALILLQSFDQTRKSFETDVEESEHLRLFAEKAPFLFSPDALPWSTSILKKGEYPERAPGSASNLPSGRSPGKTALARTELRALSRFFETIPELGVGSNNWVVSAARSQSGHALLANDPHLGLKDPPFWHWVHLSAPGIEVIGSALPGVPIITTGTNLKVSWGLTNSYFDVADVIHVPDADLSQAETVRPVIWVKVWKLPFTLPMFFKTFRIAPGGWPILPIETPSGTSAVLRWTGLSLTHKDFEGLFGLAKSTSVQETDRIFASVGVPTWNFVFADVNGGIGYRAVGNLPRYPKPPGYGIQNQTLSELSEWPVLASMEKPRILNPPRGFIATANNKQWPADSFFHAGRAHDTGFRAFRIEELLGRASEHSPSSFARIQCDLQAVDARFLLPELMSILIEIQDAASAGKDQRGWRAVKHLRDWNYQTDLDCRACPIYRRWMQRIREDLGLNAAALYRSVKLSSLDQGMRKDLANEFLLAVADLKVIDPENFPRWGDIHQAWFRPLSGQGRVFSKGLPTPGDKDSVNPGSSDWMSESHTFDHTAGASERVIVEMSQPPHVYAALTGPNAGEGGEALGAPGSPWLKWRDCRTDPKIFPLDWTKVTGEDIRL